MTSEQGSLFADLAPAHSCARGSGVAADRRLNYSRYCDPALDALIALANADPDEVARDALWREVQARVYEAQPGLFLWWLDDVTVVHRRFQDARPDLLSPLAGIERWWVKPEEVLR